MLKSLSRDILCEKTAGSRYPVKVIQFGEGNFLRAFIDWMIDIANEKGLFCGSVKVVQPIENGLADLLNSQDCLYTVVQRGIKDGQNVVGKRLITSIDSAINPYTSWADFLESGCNPDLKLVVSNTTEAGIEFVQMPRPSGICPKSFPAKLTSLLYNRFEIFDASPDSGLIIMPCELINRNGDNLKRCVLQYAKHWNLGDHFMNWIERYNVFLNTLVDRIVSGYPKSEAESLCLELGYEDKLLVACEVFHLFVIEGPQELSQQIPFAQAGLNVVWTDDLSQYRMRKVRLLNGGHTSTVLLSYLGGINTVSEMVGNELYGRFVRKVVFEEIPLSLDMDEEEKLSFAKSVLERFENPHIKHELLSISLNSVSKWRVRVLPSLTSYFEKMHSIPICLATSLSALIRFYKCSADSNGNFYGLRNGEKFQLRDDLSVLRYFSCLWSSSGDDYGLIAEHALGKVEYWGQDLNAIEGLCDIVAHQLEEIETIGVNKTLTGILDD